MPDVPADVAAEIAKGPAGLARAVESLLKTSPGSVGEALAAVPADALQGSSNLWRHAYAAFTRRIKEIQDGALSRGLDATISDLSGLLYGIWHLEGRGALWVPGEHDQPANRFAESAEAAMRKIAPPLPKKVKLDAPPRRIAPLSEARVADMVDCVMLLRALQEIGDTINRTDKELEKHYLFLEDWRRVMWESARIPSWARVRELVAVAGPVEERVARRKFSREAAVRLLEANHARRRDNLTRIPEVSMIACEHCGRFEGRERVRCAVCARMFCGRCRARTSDLCLGCYAKPKYGSLDPGVRSSIIAAARTHCAKNRLDEHVRDDAFVKVLAEQGVEVVFADDSPDDGEESQDGKGKWHLRLKRRETVGGKRLMFAAMARAHFRTLDPPPEPGLQDLFVDTCLGVQVEEALGW